jgi:hypothetical protein
MRARHGVCAKLENRQDPADETITLLGGIR